MLVRGGSSLANSGWSIPLAMWTLAAVLAIVLASPMTASTDLHVFPVTVVTDKSPASPSSCQELPSLLHVHLAASDPFPQSFELYRKDAITFDVPVYVIKSSDDGFVFTERVEYHEGEPKAAYYNEDHAATFTVMCTDTGRYILMGTMYVEGRKYQIRHHSDVTSEGVMTSFYEFAFVNLTFHHDDKLQGKLCHPESDDLIKVSAQDVDPPARAKRASETQYYVDVLVALDYAMYQYWMKRTNNNTNEAIKQAKEYIAFVYNELHSRYSRLSLPNYQIQVVPCGFLIAQTPNGSPWTEDVKQALDNGKYQVNAETVLSKLEEFVKANLSSLISHDHLMLFTEYDLYSVDNGFRFNNTAGLAYVNTMCQKNGRSVSVVEDHGGFQSENTVVHELGHSLGAKHDGDGNDCNSDDRFTMAGGVHPITTANRLNPWRFSTCSIAAFKQFVQTLTASGGIACLTNRVTPQNVPTVKGYPGQLAGPDEQCRQIYGPTSYLCRGNNFGAPNEICLSMYCRNPATTSSCTLKTAADGTCCGNKKWCYEGSCIDASNSTCYMSPTCPFGQRQGVIAENKTCDQLQSGHCYSDNFRQVCCEMCDKQHRPVYGCEYGDKVENCNASYCGLQTRYDTECCGTCAHPVTATAPTSVVVATTVVNRVPDVIDTCRDTSLVDGKEPCADFLTREGLAYCCQPKVQDFCCYSCRAMKNTSDPACPYGDCGKCAALLRKPSPCDDKERGQCCRTCQIVDHRLQSSSIPATTATNEKCVTVEGKTCGAESSIPASLWMTLSAALFGVVVMVMLLLRV